MSFHFLGSILFYLGMAINIHSDSILRNLRKSGETTYKIPRGDSDDTMQFFMTDGSHHIISQMSSYVCFMAGGLFEYVSCANYFGEILEWLGYSIAAWSLPSLSFAFFSMSFIIPRAHNHHRYQKIS